MIWPGAETILAAAASRNGLPYTLSTVAGDSIENVAAAGGAHTWFQLYATKDKDITFDLLRRARDCGVETLIVTADVPAPSRRERMCDLAVCAASGLGLAHGGDGWAEIPKHGPLC